jgi:hypothetical protein
VWFWWLALKTRRSHEDDRAAWSIWVVTIEMVHLNMHPINESHAVIQEALYKE